MADKTYWRVDKYCFSIKEVTEKKKAERYKMADKGFSQFEGIYFETKAEAVQWQKERGEKEIARLEKDLKDARTALKRFLDKNNPSN